MVREVEGTGDVEEARGIADGELGGIDDGVDEDDVDGGVGEPRVEGERIGDAAVPVVRAFDFARGEKAGEGAAGEDEFGERSGGDDLAARGGEIGDGEREARGGAVLDALIAEVRAEQAQRAIGAHGAGEAGTIRHGAERAPGHAPVEQRGAQIGLEQECGGVGGGLACGEKSRDESARRCAAERGGTQPDFLQPLHESGVRVKAEERRVETDGEAARHGRGFRREACAKLVREREGNRGARFRDHRRVEARSVHRRPQPSACGRAGASSSKC